MPVDRHHGIRLIEMSPINHPSRAYVRSGLVIVILRFVNVVNMMALLSQDMHDDREQTVPL